MTLHEIFRVALVQANTELAEQDLNDRIRVIKHSTLDLLRPLRLEGRLLFRTVIEFQTLWITVSLRSSGQRSLLEELDDLKARDEELHREVSTAVLAIRTANRHLQHLHQSKTITMSELDRMWIAHIQATRPGGVFPLQPLQKDGTLGIRVHDAFDEDFELIAEDTCTLKPTQESIFVSFRVIQISRDSARGKVSRGALKSWGLTRRDQHLVWSTSDCKELTLLNHLFKALVDGTLVTAEVRGLRAIDGRVHKLRIENVKQACQGS